MKAIIIGAGMGGMSAAIALRQIGIETAVYERVTENKPVGAAISVWSNGVKCLNYLGLEEQTAKLGGIVETMSYLDAHTGDTMCRFSMQPLIDEVGQRPYPIARAELQMMLMEAYGLDEIHFGHRMVGVADGPDAATATFADGTTAAFGSCAAGVSLPQGGGVDRPKVSEVRLGSAVTGVSSGLSLNAARIGVAALSFWFIGWIPRICSMVRTIVICE